MTKKEFHQHPAYKKYEEKVKEHQQVQMAWNVKFTNESTRFFNETMVLSPDELVIYPKAAHHYDATFEVEEVESPDELLAAVKAACGSGTDVSTGGDGGSTGT